MAAGVGLWPSHRPCTAKGIRIQRSTPTRVMSDSRGEDEWFVMALGDIASKAMRFRAAEGPRRISLLAHMKLRRYHGR